MDDFQEEGAQESVADDTAEEGPAEDHGYDNLDAAAAALAADDETGEEEAPSEDEAEGDEPEANEEDGDDEPNAEMVTLSDGTQIPISEIESGAYRQSDYTRKTTELAREREEVDGLKSQYQERTQSFQHTFQKLTQFVEGLVPPAPSLELAKSDPGQYQYQNALRQQALNELQGLMQVQEEAQGQMQGAQSQDFERYREAEAAKLAEAIPDLKDPDKRAKFDDDNRKTASDFGFSDDEIAQTADHRVLSLVHYARLGKRAEQNRKNAQRRVEAPKKGPRAAPAPEPKRDASAMKRLQQSGTIDDAVRAMIGQ